VHAAYSPCTVDDLARSGLDYWALGHVHGHAVLRAGTPWAVYPGSLQGRSPHVGERGAKGACVVEVVDGAVVDVEHVPLDRVRFEVQEVDVEGVRDVGELEGLLADRGAAALAAADGRSVLLRARLVGRGPVHADLARDGAVDGLLDALRAASPATRPFLWWEGVRDGTRPQLDRVAIAARGDFGGELLALAATLDGDELARGLVLAEWLQARPGEVDEDAFEAAVDLALDLVAGDDR